jgi:hypothetical protein
MVGSLLTDDLSRSQYFSRGITLGVVCVLGEEKKTEEREIVREEERGRRREKRKKRKGGEGYCPRKRKEM